MGEYMHLPHKPSNNPPHHQPHRHTHTHPINPPTTHPTTTHPINPSTTNPPYEPSNHPITTHPMNHPKYMYSNRVTLWICLMGGWVFIMSWPENQGILFFYISKTLEMIRISFMASLLNAVL